MAKDTLNWKTLDPQSLPKEHAALLATYKTAYAKAQEARKAFEARMNTDAKLPVGKQLVFSYRYGVGIAIGDVERKTSSSKAVSLADCLQSAMTA